MKTYTTITFTIGNTERTESFIRPRSAGMPTDRGAARMVANKLNASACDASLFVKPSDISICRIEQCGYASR